MASTPNSNTAPTPRRASKMASNQALNLNHLLNFSLPPRQTHVPSSLPRRSRGRGTQQGFWNKERFVNAQYRFVMNPSGDYTVHFADPDIFFQWTDILQVVIPRSSALASAVAAGAEYSSKDEGHTTCPICLSPPTAPRMTKCGHVFCFPCILHYLNTSENKWARCPICFDSVNEKQLKSVKWLDSPTEESDDTVPDSSSASSSSNVMDVTPHAGSTIRMRLMQRPQITTLALPRSNTWPSDIIPPHQAPFHFLPDVYNYSKFMLATPTYLIADLTADLDQLDTERRVLSGMRDELGLTFVESAAIKVREQIREASAMENEILKGRIDKAWREMKEIRDRSEYHARRRQEEAKKDVVEEEIPSHFLSTQTGRVQGSPKSVPNRNSPRQRKNVNPPPPSTSTYYYYQAASGLPIFLHPLDIRILLSHFHSYVSFPDSITVRIETLSEGTVNDDLRKHCKYLAHMPEGADVVFIEADLQDVVGAEGLKPYETPLRMRTARRNEKGRKDDRAKARAEAREREKIHTETVSWGGTGGHYITSAAQPVVVESEDAVPVVQQDTHVEGAWGARSFASALHSGRPGQRAAPRSARDEQDEWDIDVAWHELEQRSAAGGGGRRKRSNKMVVLGGGGGQRRR